MKITELHQIISRNGWVLLKGQGRGVITVPFHKGKEIPNEFARKIIKDMGIDEKG